MSRIIIADNEMWSQRVVSSTEVIKEASIFDIISDLEGLAPNGLRDFPQYLQN